MRSRNYNHKTKVNKRIAKSAAIIYDTTSFYQIDYNGDIVGRYSIIKDLEHSMDYDEKYCRGVMLVLNGNKEDKIFNGFYWVKTCEYKSDTNYSILIKYLNHIRRQKA